MYSELGTSIGRDSNASESKNYSINLESKNLTFIL